MVSSSSAISESITPTARRHDIDWLRIILFGLLIPYHVAVGLVWNTYGEAFTAETATQNEPGVLENLFLLWMHQWRLPALFIISGMGTAFAFRKRDARKFIGERFNRLIIPLLFGMFVVNLIFFWIVTYDPSDVWVRENPVPWLLLMTYIWWLINLGATLQANMADTALHMWFLANLFTYSLLTTPLFSRLQKNPKGTILKRFERIVNLPRGMGILFVVPLPLIVAEMVFKPIAYGYTGHGYEFWWYWVFFIMGYFFISVKDSYYRIILQIRIPVTIIAAVSSIIFFFFFFAGNFDPEQHGLSVYLLLDGGWVPILNEPFHTGLTVIAVLLHSYHAWFWCLVVFSWGAYLLNRPSKSLTYLNQAVYPFYISHMTFIFLGLFALKNTGLSTGITFVIVTGFTLLGCWVTFELVKRNKNTRRIFGIKEVQTQRQEGSDEMDPEPPESVFCSACASEIIAGNNFCTYCGNPVHKENQGTIRESNE